MRPLPAAALALALLALPGVAGADALDDLAPGSWLELPTSKLRDVCPPDTPSYDWSFHCQNVTLAWGGAAFDTTRGRLIVFGGGHADYKGNEVYVFDMTSLAWSRVWGPTPDAQIPDDGTNEQYADGNPGSRHTYSGLSYVPPPVDGLLSMGGSLWKSGNYAVGTWAFSFEKNTWARKKDGPSEQGYGDPSVYDPKTGHVFRRANSRVFEYDPVADTYTPRFEANGGFWATDVSAALDAEARLMVLVGSGRVDLYHLDTDQYEADVAVVGATVKDLFGSGAPGLDFDTAQKKLVLWKGGQDVYTFDPAAKTFSKHTGAGADPGPVTTSGGVYGRFRYVPSRNVFIRLNSVDENVFAFRMAPGTGTPLPKPDAGGVGGAGSGGLSGAGGGASSDAGDDSSCGCRLAGQTSRGPSAALTLIVLALGAARRRRAN